MDGFQQLSAGQIYSKRFSHFKSNIIPLFTNPSCCYPVSKLCNACRKQWVHWRSSLLTLSPLYLCQVCAVVIFHCPGFIVTVVMVHDLFTVLKIVTRSFSLLSMVFLPEVVSTLIHYTDLQIQLLRIIAWLTRLYSDWKISWLILHKFSSVFQVFPRVLTLQ